MTRTVAPPEYPSWSQDQKNQWWAEKDVSSVASVASVAPNGVRENDPLPLFPALPDAEP
jgi:hypothetical protein